jgi:3-isopropylmalate dehydrogenase
MLCRYSLQHGAAADHIERAVASVLFRGHRTGDIVGVDFKGPIVGTAAMGDAVIAALDEA